MESNTERQSYVVPQVQGPTATKGFDLEPTTPTDTQIRDTIKTMGADDVTIARYKGAMYVSFHRMGGCGRIHVNICNYMKDRFPSTDIILLESPQLGKWCQKARIRESGAAHFSKTSILATASRLGVF